MLKILHQAAFTRHSFRGGHTAGMTAKKKLRKKAGARASGRTARTAAKKSGATGRKAAASRQYKDLNELLVLKLQSLYDIESELIKALPKLARAAASYELKEAFEIHLHETKGQAARLEEAMRLLGVRPAKEKVSGIRGIAEDGAWVAGHTNAKTRDAALIAAAQYAEHYEIAGYAAAREWAAMMDHQAVADLLDATLLEEQAASDKLAELAHTGINQKAGGISMEEDEPAEIDTVAM
jgi:ferritin-like metal-binding protein YciE